MKNLETLFLQIRGVWEPTPTTPRRGMWGDIALRASQKLEVIPNARLSVYDCPNLFA